MRKAGASSGTSGGPTGPGGGAIARQRADWSDLRLFFAVASTGGFGAAAKALGVTQPTVSRRIDELEHRLGTKLLNRGPHGVAMTQAGEAVYDHVLTMERSSCSIERLVSGADRREEGTVGIAGPDGVAGFLVAPMLGEFFQANPKISVTLDCGLWPGDPLPGVIDIALQFHEAADPDVITTPLAHFHYVLSGSKAYFDLYGRPASLQEAAAHRYVHHSAQNKQPAGQASTTPALQQLVDKRLATNSSAAMIYAIRNGAGIGPMPTVAFTLYPELEMLDLPVIATAQLWMCVHREIAGSARVRRVSEWLTTLFDGREQPWYRAEFIPPSEFASLAEPACGRAR
jgi:DNA-binding transcriptional LysR family regulator